jgi:hypothetical protein
MNQELRNRLNAFIGEILHSHTMKKSATYTPVNNLDNKEADAIIDRDYPLLVEDLRKHAGPETAIVLVKANVCTALEPKLNDAGFKVFNDGVSSRFPGTGNQGKFRTAIRKVLGLKD